MLTLIAVFAIMLTSCGDDEDQCTTNLAGTYTGINSCGGEETDETITISGTDGDYSVSGLYNSSLDQDGCTLSFSNTLLGVGEEVVFTFTDSTAVRVEQSEAATGASICVFTGTK